MKCPHCLDSYHPQTQLFDLGRDEDSNWKLVTQICPNCKKFIMHLVASYSSGMTKSFLVYPKAISRVPISPDVPDKFAGDYKEACLVISDSPKASAALSRRCLQNILREKAKVKPQV